MITAVPFITAHAIERYQQRVDSNASRRVALREIREILAHAHARPRPRHWTHVDVRPGCRYLYSARRPGVCVVVRGQAVVTVFSRASCSTWNPSPDGGGSSHRVAYRRPSPNTWRVWEAA